MKNESFWNRISPALLLAFLAPMFAEVLPGATRFSSIFVFPIEMAVWGGGAVLARAIVRKQGLGWYSLLLLGVALAVAEELLIQQTSTAPMVIRLKGETWGRAFDINYVYLVWALAYESLWVVVLPTLAVEIVFPERRNQPWLNRSGAIVTTLAFMIGSILAWFTWTQIARTKVFHQPAYSPPVLWIGAAAALIGGLILAAVWLNPRQARSRPAPPPWLLAIIAAIWAALWFGLVVLAFGIAPQFSAPAAAAGAVIVIALLLFIVPQWAADAGWERAHSYAVIAGGLTASMAVSFVGFIGASPADLWFKVIADIAALVGLVWLGSRARRPEANAAQPG